MVNKDDFQPPGPYRMIGKIRVHSARTMEMEWQDFRKAVYPDVTDLSMLSEIRAVFFAGGLAFYTAMNSTEAASEDFQVECLKGLLREVGCVIEQHIERRLKDKKQNPPPRGQKP